MTGDLIVKLVNSLGFACTDTGGSWLNCSCVFASWLHSGGIDANPSFGIFRNDSGESFYKCWSCGKTGSVSSMVFDLIMLQRKQPVQVHIDFSVALHLIANEAPVSCPSYKPVAYEEDIPEACDLVFSTNWLQSFPRCYSFWYLSKRGISKNVAKRLDIRLDPVDKRICFPMRNSAGLLIGLQGRTYCKSPMRWKLYKCAGVCNRQIWGNESNVDLGMPLVLTEGFTDLAKIIGVYPNVLCSLTSSLTVEKAYRIIDATQIITFFDVGTGGDHARSFVTKFFKNAYIAHIIPTDSQDDAGNMSSQEIGSCLSRHINISSRY